MGEADLRLAEMKKLEYEFDRDIVRGAINPVSYIFITICVEYPVMFQLHLCREQETS